MNLKALFNLNYFKENIRKSKGVLAFLFGVIPLLNIIFLIICILEENTTLDFSSLGTITLLGMYIIPISLAISLFGFVFKQKSVDFVMSKPISRKSIYFTNIIGGIIVLALFIIINTFIFGLFGTLFSNLIIPLNLLIDYFIFYLISYIFMFIVTSLAVSIAGNFITSIVVLFIVIFLYPFLNITVQKLTNSSVINYINCQEEVCKPLTYECYNSVCQEELAQNNYNYYLSKEVGSDFTTPIRMFTNYDNMYSTKVIVKMVILSIIYIGLGYLSFKTRKMEDNETDFKTDFKHYFVKSIVFLPVCIITFLLISELGIVGLLISITLALIYYIVYDLIVRKEIYRFSKSLLIAVITFGIFNGCYKLLDMIEKNNVLDLKDIKSLKIDINDYTYEITDHNIINALFKDALVNDGTVLDYYNVIINTKKGNYYTDITLGDTATYQMFESYIANQRKDIIVNFNYNNIDGISYNSENIPVTKELKKILTNDIKNYQSHTNSYITVKKYQNHDYQYLLIPVNLSEDLYKYIIGYSNAEALSTIKENKNIYDFFINEISSSNNLYFTELDQYIAYYVFQNNLDSFIEYLENDNKITYTDSYIDIECYSYDYYTIRISDVKKFKQEFDRYKELLENEAEYQNLITEYYNNNKEVKYEY